MLEKAAKIFVILPQVFPQSIEPCTAFIVSGYRGDNAERINVAHFVDVDGEAVTVMRSVSFGTMTVYSRISRRNSGESAPVLTVSEESFVFGEPSPSERAPQTPAC